MFYFYPIRLRTNHPNFIVPMLIKIVTLTVILFSVTPGIATADKKTPGQGIPLQYKKMVGDFDEMVQHRRIRALVTYSKTFYFLDRGRQYGLSYEALKAFGKFVNKKLKTKTLKFHDSEQPCDQLFRQSAGKGTYSPHRRVSIGYDTPWRQVHEMLLMAARKTPGLLADPEPFVLQKSLDDFYVTYELNVYTDKPEKMTIFYSELHQNILDVFNEYGVQIMSPNYVADRAEPAIVTKERWYVPPTKPPVEE